MMDFGSKLSRRWLPFTRNLLSLNLWQDGFNEKRSLCQPELVDFLQVLPTQQLETCKNDSYFEFYFTDSSSIFLTFLTLFLSSTGVLEWFNWNKFLVKGNHLLESLLPKSIIIMHTLYMHAWRATVGSEHNKICPFHLCDGELHLYLAIVCMWSFELQPFQVAVASRQKPLPAASSLTLSDDNGHLISRRPTSVFSPHNAIWTSA